MPRRLPAAVCCALLALPSVLLPGLVARGDDWPQWMGPQRDNEWRETGILEQIPETGLRVLWRAPVAGGYAGPAVAGGRVFVADYVADETIETENFERRESTGTERVLCLDEATGQQLWKHEYPVQYTISYPAGPRCTPTVEGDRVYTLGAEGDLICFDAASGRIHWQSNLRLRYETRAALWGYANHPLIDGQKLIVIAGGQGSHAVALDKLTGAEIWRSLTAPEQGYCPPTILEAAGVRQLILMRPDALSSVDPETGKEYWSVPYSADNGSIIMTPVQWRDHLFVGGFNGRNLLVRLDSDKPGASTVWRDVRNAGMSPVNVQPRVEGDVLYGVDGSGELMALELPSGKRIWTTPQPISARKTTSGTAFLIKQGDRYWLFNELGEVLLARITPAGYTELGRAQVIQPTDAAFGRHVVWCAPAMANRHLYVRNGTECICVDLSQP
jgi:outer membrane protein assembly factor BamB